MIQELIDESIKAENSKERTPSGKYKPSLFGRCYRLQFWKRKNLVPSNTNDDRTLRVFKVGSMFHGYVQDIIIAKHPEIKKEVLIETEDVKGFADLVSEDEVIDLKTQHSRAFHYMRKSEDILKDKMPNVLQVSWYALKLSKDRARLAFVSKDDLCIQEVSFPVERYRGDVESEYCDLKSFWDKDELPPAQPRAYNGKDCLYCEFLDMCMNLELSMKREHPYKPKVSK
jgi:hypothetical protein